ncbi:hypothetical protein CVS47_00780 [Microbacterium lemovicicum]|uniref:Protein-glutamine gamma-glutamyltransferase-like C-terminal domain-containing protein n=1 Tax=Microbacterium lemovicicum TaxID=1072463 RepID=A0A3S9W7W0_9MICO|nr:hypothetical protein CVS47_00780 [Microbacterium lemovicicum]
MIVTLLPPLGLDAPPLTPDGDEARRWAEQELTDPSYAVSEPTAIDRLARAIGDFFANLFNGQVEGGWGSLLAVIVVVVLIALVVAALLIWGRPRALVRSRTVPAGELFGDAEERTAAQLRAEAQASAAAGEWVDAVVLRFRALARGLDERGVVDAPPGTTVHGFARAAARAFPDAAAELDSAAAAFDDVRYLRRPGTAELYQRIVAVDDDVQRRTPLTPATLSGSLS